jgi:hypothetical protein
VPVVGSRFLIEAVFIIAVAVIAGIERLGTGWIILVVAAAWILIAVVEIVVWARQGKARQARGAAGTQPVAPQRVHSAVVPAEPVPTLPAEPTTPVWEPPRMTAVPALAPEPPQEHHPEPAVQPEPVLATAAANVVAFTPANDTPREWNLWELERAAKDHADDDVARVEERAYLLMYLREFAGPDGVLPSDFDGLVRDAFGDVLHSVGA